MRRTFTQEPKHEWNEAEAIQRAQRGDAAAFEYLYKTHSKRVFSICLRTLKNTSDAEDVTQQVFLQVFRKIGTFRGDCEFSTWLYRVAFNAVLKHLRQRKPCEIRPNGSNPDSGGTDFDTSDEFNPRDTSMLGAIERLNLMRAIRKLPAGYKRLLLLHDVMGYMHCEIAKLVGCSIGCSKSQVHKARKRLQHMLYREQGRVEHDVGFAGRQKRFAT